MGTLEESRQGIALMSISTHALVDFQNRHRLRPPAFIRDHREAIQLGTGDGVRTLESAPATGIRTGHPPTPSLNRESLHRYLWVIDAQGIPYIIELPIQAIGGSPKHTNLTGGGKAYVGGELWFASPESVYISGGSGRYHPADTHQLDNAVEVFESFGYSVTSLGWDYILGEAKRFLGDA